jgi:hypothetical protein
MLVISAEQFGQFIAGIITARQRFLSMHAFLCPGLNLPCDMEAHRRETSHGTLYEPQPFGFQVALLAGSFMGGPALGWLLGLVLEESTPAARLFLYVPPTLVFFLGYALWSARLAAIAFEMIGKSILRVLLRVLIKREPPRKETLLPDAEKLALLVLRAQKAGRSFFLVSVPIAAVSGVLALFFRFNFSGAVAVAAVCLLWGYGLGALGRRGYLPLPEPGD